MIVRLEDFGGIVQHHDFISLFVNDNYNDRKKKKIPPFVNVPTFDITICWNCAAKNSQKVAEIDLNNEYQYLNDALQK